MKLLSLPKIDWWLLAPVVLLLIISLTTLFSLNSAFFRGQLFTLAIAVSAFFVFSQIPYDLLRRLSVPFYIISIILLVIVLILGIEAKGAVRWVYIFGFPIQFSEVLKPFLAISFSSFLANSSSGSLRSYIFSLIYLAPIFLLIALQPDLGNSMIYLLVTGLVLIVYGFPWKWFALTALPFVLLSPILWHFLREYQRLRLLTFINPTSDPLGSSYNLIQAVIAVGSGMVMGKGLSLGTQSGLRFLPERHTDFIFASLSESMGFIGATIVLVCFLALCYRIYRLFARIEDTFCRMFAVCTFAFILVHFFVNIAMNLGLIPIVGVTLPFVSYGGSSLLSNFILLGILSSIATAHRRQRVLEIR